MVQPFYDALAAGLSVGDALRTAKLSALRRGAPPREWAAFTAVGDPLIRIPLREPPSAWRVWTAGLFAAATLLGVLIYLAAGQRRAIGMRR